MNVCGDCVGCAIVNAICHDKLTESRKTVVARGNSLKRQPSHLTKNNSAAKMLDDLSSEPDSIPITNGVELSLL